MGIPTAFGIHWFRRDLRVSANPALKAGFERNLGRVVGLFCFDSRFLSRPDFSHHRFAFFLATLDDLKTQMRALGSDLLVIDEQPKDAFKKLNDHFKETGDFNLKTVSFNRDYEPFARARDETVTNQLETLGIEVLTERDHLVLEPHEVNKDSGGFYQVFTPFSRKWLEKFNTPAIQDRLRGQLKESKFEGELTWKTLAGKNPPYEDAFNAFFDANSKNVTIPIPRAGREAALDCVDKFKPKLKKYKEDRDIPSAEGTSRISIFLKNGSATTTDVILKLGLEKQAGGLGGETYLKELIWREFYYHILYHVPRVETESFNPKYKDIKWINKKQWFKRWCEGTTGFPIVDAGMRQMNATGWMHNRVRMIVASFLTKDLLINWQWGENYFMKMLLDGDLAPNNGGWQWAASTGCDPQPYFRIFNPDSQQEKFDPDFTYIKEWIPEYGTATYPKPIVDHKVQRAAALKLYS